MSTIVDRKSYLLKYLKGPSNGKKKKKRKIMGKGLRIIDDDIDVSMLHRLSDDDIEAHGLDDEDAPQIAGIVDERPDDIKEMERFNVNKWRVIAENHGTGSLLRVEEVQGEEGKIQDKKCKEKNSLIFGKMYSDSEGEQKNDPDISPSRKTCTKPHKSANINRRETKGESPSRQRNKSLAPPDQTHHGVKIQQTSKNPRENRINYMHERRNFHVAKSTPSRRNDSDDIDLLFHPRTSKNPCSSKYKFSSKIDQRPEDDCIVPPFRQSRQEQDICSKGNPNLKRYRQKGSDPDLSPPRKSAPKKDLPKSDLSPPIKSRPQKGDLSSKRGKNVNNDSDLSPPRNTSRKMYSRSKRKQKYDSDLSTARKDTTEHDKVKKPSRWGYFEPEKSENSYSDLSPPSKYKKESFKSPVNKYSNRHGNCEEFDIEHGPRSYDGSPPSNTTVEKTLEGKKAGLQSARGLRDEAAELRRREDYLFDSMAPELSGRAATAASRRLGKRYSTAERDKNQARETIQKEMDEKYANWNRGLKQLSEDQWRQADFLHEASKPLARTRDDADLECSLKAVERVGDPMLEYFRTKRQDDTRNRPTYAGSFPPNRFDVRPGHRWDGVDRSSGYENRLFESRSRATALQEEAYKWSTEDL